MSSLFGGSKSKSTSTSDNQAFGTISDWANPLLGYTQQGASGLASLLGGDTTGLDNFKSAMGYNWELGQGTDNVLSKAASIGGLDSGATLKGLADYQTGLNNQYGTNYLNSLLGLSGIGTSAAGTLAGAGSRSNSTSTSKSGGGLAPILGGIAQGVASGGF